MSSHEIWLDALVRASLQGALLATLVWFGFRLARRSTPELRSWIWVLVLAKFALSLFFVWQLAVLPPAPEAATLVHGTEAMLGLVPLPAEAQGPPLILWLWLGGACTVAAMACLGHLRLLKTLRASTPASVRVRWLALNLAQGDTDVRTHPDIPVPMIAGMLRPVIYVPESFETDLDEAEIRMVLAHELAHVERRDAAARVFVLACQSLFFFHPVVWIARREWQVASESSCDRRAMDVTGATPHAYAAMLLKISVGSRRAPAFALSVVPADKTLHRRIENMKTPTHRTMLSRFGAFAAILTISILAMPFALAQRAPDGQKSKTKQSSHASQESLDSARMKVEILVKSGQISDAEGQTHLKALDQRALSGQAQAGGRLTRTGTPIRVAKGEKAKILKIKGVPVIDRAKLDAAGLRYQEVLKGGNLAETESLLSKAKVEYAKALQAAAAPLANQAKMDEARARLQETHKSGKLIEAEGVLLKSRVDMTRALELAGASQVDKAKLDEARVRLQEALKSGKLIEAERLLLRAGGEYAKALEVAKLAELGDPRKVEGLLYKSRLDPAQAIAGAPLEIKRYTSALEAARLAERELEGAQTRIRVGSLLRPTSAAAPARIQSERAALEAAIKKAIASGEIDEGQGRAKIESLMKQMSYKEIRDRLAAATAEIKKAVAEGRMTFEEGKAQIEEFKKALGGG